MSPSNLLCLIVSNADIYFVSFRLCVSGMRLLVRFQVLTAADMLGRCVVESRRNLQMFRACLLPPSPGRPAGCKISTYIFDRALLISQIEVVITSETSINFTRLHGVTSQNWPVMAHAVSRRHLTAEAWVRAWVSPCGICGGQSDTGTSFPPSSSISPVNVIPPWMNNRSVDGHSWNTVSPHRHKQHEHPRRQISQWDCCSVRTDNPKWIQKSVANRGWPLYSQGDMHMWIL
jgi:hypothetical protein